MKIYNNLNTDQILNLRMLGGDLVETEDGSSIVWYSPNREYKFIINRKMNELWISKTSYMITIDIYDNLNIYITRLITTEYGIIELIYDLLSFTDPEVYEFQPYSSIRIVFDPLSDLSDQSIYIERDGIVDDDGNPFMTNNPYFSEDYDELREILFKVEKSNSINNISSIVVTFNISDTELVLFAFVLFFAILIDIDIPPRYMSEIEYITQRFVE